MAFITPTVEFRCGQPPIIVFSHEALVQIDVIIKDVAQAVLASQQGLLPQQHQFSSASQQEVPPKQKQVKAMEKLKADELGQYPCGDCEKTFSTSQGVRLHSEFIVALLHVRSAA